MFQDEFANMRIKIREIMEENLRLHNELKKSVMEEIASDIDLQKVTENKLIFTAVFCRTFCNII